MRNQFSAGCSCEGDTRCCPLEQTGKQVEIDFLYLDLSVCQRCQGAESNLEAAINEVSGVLKAAGYEVKVNKINIVSRDMAIQHEFVSSPTIRINGNDISLGVNETVCKACGDLCGDTVDCRSWIYEGGEYPEPPKAMIVSAILREVFGGNQAAKKTKASYVLPANLKVFFDGIEIQKK